MIKRIGGFDGVRGLAAIAVVLTHLNVYAWLKSGGWVSGRVIDTINGGAGVQVFFVLSGFLITSLLVDEHEKNGSISKYNFFVRRTLRIFPLYFLVILLVASAHLLGGKVTNWNALLFAATYTTNFIPREHYSQILGHTWSLAVEEHFYLLWPFVFSFFAADRTRLLFFLMALILFSFIFSCVVTVFGDFTKGYFVNRWSFVAGVNIAFGCIAALIVVGDKARAMAVGGRVMLLTGGLLAVSSYSFLKPLSVYVGEYVRGFGFTLLILWLYLNQQGVVVRLLEMRPLRYLGTVSYGIYLYQGFFLSTGPYRVPGQSWPPTPVVGLLLLILVVPLSHRYFESPILALKSKYQKLTGSR